MTGSAPPEERRNRIAFTSRWDMKRVISESSIRSRTFRAEFTSACTTLPQAAGTVRDRDQLSDTNRRADMDRYVA